MNLLVDGRPTIDRQWYDAYVQIYQTSTEKLPINLVADGRPTIDR